jgi:outer membrane lipoprotein SlyB
MTTGMGGAGKIIGGGRGISICTLTPAIAETGAKTTRVKNNIFKINFFIRLPPS